MNCFRAARQAGRAPVDERDRLFPRLVGGRAEKVAESSTGGVERLRGHHHNLQLGIIESQRGAADPATTFSQLGRVQLDHGEATVA